MLPAHCTITFRDPSCGCSLACPRTVSGRVALTTETGAPMIRIEEMRVVGVGPHVSIQVHRQRLVHPAYVVAIRTHTEAERTERDQARAREMALLRQVECPCADCTNPGPRKPRITDVTVSASPYSISLPGEFTWGSSVGPPLRILPTK